MNLSGLTFSVTALANAISEKITNEEAALLAAFLVQLGDTLATIATAKSIYEAKSVLSEKE